MNFRVNDDEVVHRWAMFALVRRTLTDPGGNGFERTFVSTPGAVAVVPVTESGHLVLVSQYRPAIDAYVLELPAGMRDVEGEDPVDTARRELAEETGWEASEFTYVGRCLSSPAVTNSSVLIYKATGLRPALRAPHGPEEIHMDVVTPTIDEAVTMVRDGRITDAKTCYGIFMVLGSGSTGEFSP